MAKTKIKTSLEKNVYLSDIHDEEYFDEIIGKGKYMIFDKDEIINQIKSKNIDGNVLNYISNIEISKALTKIIRNKKIKAIIYLVYTSSTKTIMDNINTKILPKLNISINVRFHVITTKVDLGVYQYNKQPFDSIHVRD